MRLTRHLGDAGTTWLAMKGVHPYDELAQVEAVSSEVVPLSVPGLEAQRHLVLIRLIEEMAA
jgi:16S rRNA (guanine527-N7)-methyltransferase